MAGKKPDDPKEKARQADEKDVEDEDKEAIHL